MFCVFLRHNVMIWGLLGISYKGFFSSPLSADADHTFNLLSLCMDVVDVHMKQRAWRPEDNL